MDNPSPAFFAEQLRKGFEDDPWHGPSVSDNLRDITAQQAAARPVPAAHSIWELVLHLTGWQREVRRRLLGGEPGYPPDGDWPEVPEPTDGAWEAARRALAESTAAIRETVASMSPEDLERTVGRASRPLGTGVTLAAMLSGLLQHNAYHSGQIALLRKAVGA
jgi:uncharacterized damage-inducible protein DinB